MAKGDKLTPKQKKFIKEYLETGNATEAAEKAYNTNNKVTAWAIGYENLKKPLIEKNIQERVQDAKNMIYTIAMTWEKEETRLRACIDITDRGEGKPMQRIEQTSTNYDVDVTSLSDEEIDKIINWA